MRRFGGGPAVGNSGASCWDSASGDGCVAARSWGRWCRVVYVTLPLGTSPTCATAANGAIWPQKIEALAKLGAARAASCTIDL
eukprot:8454156-Pyramimonas_sp.AAC.1